MKQPASPSGRTADGVRTPAGVIHLIESDGLYGAGRVVLSLAHQATGDPDFPAAIGCILPEPAQAHPFADRVGAEGLRVLKLQLRPSRVLSDLVVILRHLRSERPAILHTHGYKAAIIGYATHLVTGVPVLATCHGWADDSQGKRSYRWLTSLERFLYRFFTCVVAVSPRIAAQLRQWHVRADRIVEVPNGIALQGPPSPAIVTALRQRERIPAGTPVVLHVGRLSEEKGQTDLVEAARQLIHGHPTLRVLILGDGPLRATLESQIAQCGVTEAVKLLGFRDNVRDYLALADVFALPSLTEGLPLSVLEALDAGVPVVCTPVGALPSLLEDGVSGLFVPVHSPAALADAIERLIKEPELRRALAMGGSEVVRRTATAQAMHRRYRDLYVRLTRG